MNGGRGQAISLGGDEAIPLPITVICPGFVNVVANDIIGGWYRVTRPLGDTFQPGKVYVTAKGTATSATVKFDVKVSTNDGSSWTTALGSTKIELPTGVHINEQLALTWAITDFNDGDLIRIDIIQADPSAYGIMFQIFPVS